MKRIIILVGISGSGKSTWANNYFKENPLSTIIVNRDKIRESLFGFTENSISEYYNLDKLNSFEKQVTLYENIMIKEALTSSKTVIIDATHLKRSYIEKYKYFNVETEIKFFDIDVETAILNDFTRNRQVGKDVIKKQSKRYRSLTDSLKSKPIIFEISKLKINKSNPPCYIFDIDGTLAHKGNRSPYDWNKVEEDSGDSAVIHLAELVNNSDAKLIICTGRDGVCTKETQSWLEDFSVKFDEFYIRTSGDYRPDWIVKEEMWRDIAKNYNILGMFDDRNQVVDRARNLGLKVLHVEYHNF